MGRKSVMIQFDAAAFRQTVKARGEALSRLEPTIGVTKQALNGWLTASRIPPRQLYAIADKLGWSPDELAFVLKKKAPETLALAFRSHRHTLPSPKSEETARELARDFFLLDSLAGDYPKTGFALRVEADTPAPVLAEAILRQLNLKRGQFGLEELLQSLVRVNINVIFVDFGLHFSVDDQAAKAIRAFAAKRKDRYLIVVDSRTPVEDVAWVIFHELTHIVCGYFEQDETDEANPSRHENEKFCNEVANEVFTPTEFFRTFQSQIESIINCELRFLPSRVEHLASQLGASFQGTLLALKKEQFLTPQRERYLWGVHKRRKTREFSVKDLVQPSEADSRDELLKLWDKFLNTEELQKFLRLHLLVRQGSIENKISVSRAAELLGLDFGDMEELCNYWTAEVSSAVAD